MQTDLEAAFLAEMVERPEDDTTRLVFADWLDDHGDPDRAAFIRAQCGPDRDDPSAGRRADELLQAHRAAWEAPFQAIEAEVRFRRGFPWFLKADVRRLGENADLLSLAPEWHLALTRDFDDLDDDPDVAHVEPYARLGAVPFAARIRTLNFAWSWCHPDEVTAVLTPAITGAVRELRFGDDFERRAILARVLAALGLRLRTLAFLGDSSGGLADAGCRMLAEAPQLAGLRGLELPNNHIEADGVAALAASPHVRGLVDLDLAGGSNSTNTIGPAGARHLAGSDNFRHLENLDLVYNHIGDAGLAALAESSHLGALRSLNLPGNDVTDGGLIALARAAGLPALDWLNVCTSGRGGITAAGIQALTASPRMARLTGLKLADNPIGDAGAAALAEAPGRLRELYVRGCGIGFDGFVRMLASPHLAGVTEFHTAGNAVSAEETRELKARFGQRVK